MRLIVGGVCQGAYAGISRLLYGLTASSIDIGVLQDKGLRPALHTSLAKYANDGKPIVVQLPPAVSGTSAGGEDRWAIAHRVLSETEDSRAILAFLSPAESLAEALKGRCDTREILLEWRANADAAIALRKRFRARVLLVNARAALAEPARVLHLCEDKLGVRLGASNFGNLELVEVNPILALLARELVMSEDGMTERLAAMEASSVMGLAPSVQARPGALAEALQTLLHPPPHVQSPLPPPVPPARDAEGPEILGQFLQAQQELEFARNELAELRSERDWRREEVDQLARAMKKGEGEAKKAWARVSQLRGEIVGYEQQIASMRGSLSWRLTAPIRAISARLTFLDPRALKHFGDIQIVRESSYFDAEWYVNQYRDVVDSGIEPVVHFVRYGGTEGRAPSPLFSVEDYLARYPDVARTGVNALVHYLRYGASEGRTASPVRSDRQGPSV